MFPLVSIDGIPAPHNEDAESVRLDLNPDDAYPAHICRECGAGLTETAAGWVDENDDTCCPQPSGDDQDTADNRHVAAAVPLAWCNSATIRTDATDDAVTVTLSAGDCRGGLSLCLRRVRADADSPFAGCLLLHTPHTDEVAPHVALSEVRPGTYIVGALPSARI